MSYADIKQEACLLLFAIQLLPLPAPIAVQQTVLRQFSLSYVHFCVLFARLCLKSFLGESLYLFVRWGFLDCFD